MVPRDWGQLEYARYASLGRSRSSSILRQVPAEDVRGASWAGNSGSEEAMVEFERLAG